VDYFMAETLQKSFLDTRHTGDAITSPESGANSSTNHENVVAPHSRNEKLEPAVEHTESLRRRGAEVLSTDHFRTLLGAYGTNLGEMRRMKAAEQPEQ
jgi:hypothetical protein